MKLKFSYEEMFQKNIGAFTKEEASRIRNLKVAIAGAGGLGGPLSYILARLGVGEVRLADPDIFDVTNINRQFGAYIDTVGQYKTEAIKNELLRINPYLVIKNWNVAINRSNIKEFLDGADVVIDGIDFFELEAENLLHKEAFKRKLWIFTCQGAGNIISYLTFNPNGVTLEKMISENGKLSLRKAIAKMFPILPREATSEIIDEVVSGIGDHIPSYSVLPPIGGALVAEEMIKVLIRKKTPAAEAPDLFLIDLEKMNIIFYKNGRIQKR